MYGIAAVVTGPESDFETELEGLKSADEDPLTGDIRLKLRLKDL